MKIYYISKEYYLYISNLNWAYGPMTYVQAKRTSELWNHSNSLKAEEDILTILSKEDLAEHPILHVTSWEPP